MIRLLNFLLVLALAAAGFAWIADRPGEVSVVWLGQRYETSVAVALLGVLLAAIAFTIFWGLLRFVLRIDGTLLGRVQCQLHRSALPLHRQPARADAAAPARGGSEAAAGG